MESKTLSLEASQSSKMGKKNKQCNQIESKRLSLPNLLYDTLCLRLGYLFIWVFHVRFESSTYKSDKMVQNMHLRQKYRVNQKKFPFSKAHRTKFTLRKVSLKAERSKYVYGISRASISTKNVVQHSAILCTKTLLFSV